MENKFSDKNDLWDMFMCRLIEKAHSCSMPSFVDWYVQKILIPHTLKGNKVFCNEINNAVGLKSDADMAKLYFKLCKIEIPFQLNAEYKF